MTFDWPQIVYVSIVALGLVLHAVRDGEPREDQYRFGVQLISSSLVLALLWAGGFFG